MVLRAARKCAGSLVSDCRTLPCVLGVCPLSCRVALRDHESRELEEHRRYI